MKFKYKPLQYVTSHAYGLNIQCARILRCIWDGAANLPIYDVEYAYEGSIRRQEFYEDQLELKDAQ